MKKNIVCKLSLDGSPSSEFSGMCSSLASVNEGILIWNEKEKICSMNILLICLSV